MRTVWRRCIDCGVYFDRSSMHHDPRQRQRFGKPLFVCSDCKPKIEMDLKEISPHEVAKLCTGK
jgi:hypothetical protein